MPTIEVKELDPCKKELIIEVPDGLYKEEVEKLYRQYGKEISLPGFRKGKVPRNVIENRYGPKVKEDAINQTIPKAYNESLKELKITPIGKPVISNVTTDQKNPIRFTATVEHLPVFELNRYKGFELKWEVVKVADDEISAEIKAVQEQFAELESVSGRSAQKDDYAIIDYKGTIDGKPFEGGEGKGVQVCLGGAGFLKEFEDGVIGMSLGDKKDVEVPFPEDYQNKELAGKKAVFNIILNEIKIKNFPELSDDFVQKNCNEENLEALKASIRKRLEEQEEEKGKQDLKEKLYLKIHEANNFTVPESLVDSQARMMTYNGMRRMGFTDEMIQKSDENFLKFKEALLPTARTSVISQLVMEKIETLEKMEVTDEEMNEELKKHRTSDQVQTDDKAHRDFIRAKLIEEKVYDFLVSNNKTEKVFIDRPKNISDNEKV